MILKTLLFIFCFVSFAWPLAAQQLHYQHGKTDTADQRVRCGRIGCIAVTPRPGCRRVRLGGMFGSNAFKVVCDNKKG
jgi:hypothetical protein